MGCESEPPTSYNELSNHYYYIMLNYKEFPSTPQIHLPHPDPTIKSSVSSPASDLPQ